MVNIPTNGAAAGAAAAGTVVQGFSGAPALLLIALINITVIGFAGYYLVQVDHNRLQINMQTVALLQQCIDLAGNTMRSEQNEQEEFYIAPPQDANERDYPRPSRRTGPR